LRQYSKGELGYDGDVVLLQFAYTFEQFRGRGIVAAAMAQIAEQRLPLGARWALTCVKHDDVADAPGRDALSFRRRITCLPENCKLA
jgi:hypothetical protein